MTRSTTRGRRSSPSTSLVAYLNDSCNWKADKLIKVPQITCEKRLRKARNSVKRSRDNNDVLEFIGDRIINLACCLMVDSVKISSEHHRAVGHVLCNNDTLGRIAYQAILHTEAIFGYNDEKRVQDWHPDDNTVPPKALADIFEAYVGAVYEEHAWEVVFGWLQSLYMPLIPLATEDFLKRANSSRSVYDFKAEDQPELALYQGRVWDYLYFKRSFLTEHGLVAVDALPSSTQFLFSPSGELVNDSDRSEVASNLINFWICKIFMRVFPHLLEATYRGAHLVTWLTYLVTSEDTLGYLGSMLSLSTFFDHTDIDCNSARLLMDPQRLDSTSQVRQASYCNKLALSVKAVIGWYYLQDSVDAEKWGEKWFQPIVIRAHDIIAEDPNYRPSVPESARDTLTKHAAALASASASQSKVSVDELAQGLAGIGISSTEIPSVEPKPLSDILESQEEAASDVILVTRVNDESLKKFHPLPNVPLTGGDSSRGGDSQYSDLKAQALLLGNHSVSEKYAEDQTSAEQWLVSMFKGVNIGSDAQGAQLVVQKPIKLDNPSTWVRLSSQSEEEKENFEQHQVVTSAKWKRTGYFT